MKLSCSDWAEDVDVELDVLVLVLDDAEAPFIACINALAFEVLAPWIVLIFFS